MAHTAPRRMQVLFKNVSNHKEWSQWTSTSKPITMQPCLLGRRAQTRAYSSCKIRLLNISVEKTHIMHFNNSQCFFCTILMKYMHSSCELCNISVPITKTNYARPHWTSLATAMHLDWKHCTWTTQIGRKDIDENVSNKCAVGKRTITKVPKLSFRGLV